MQEPDSLSSQVCLCIVKRYLIWSYGSVGFCLNPDQYTKYCPPHSLYIEKVIVLNLSGYLTLLLLEIVGNVENTEEEEREVCFLFPSKDAQAHEVQRPFTD